MSHLRKLAAFTVVASLAISGVALAAASKITGGTSQISISSAVSSALTANHLTLTALAPATSSGSTFTFPISGGRLNTTTLRGYIRQQGGLAISNGTATVKLRRLTIDSTKKGAAIYALVDSRTLRECTAARHHVGKRCDYVIRSSVKRIARLTVVSVSGSTASGTVDLTKYSARVINKLAGTSIATAGMAIGTATSSPTFG